MLSARIDYAPVEEPSKFHSFRSLRLVTLESTVCAREGGKISARSAIPARSVCSPSSCRGSRLSAHEGVSNAAAERYAEARAKRSCGPARCAMLESALHWARRPAHRPAMCSRPTTAAEPQLFPLRAPSAGGCLNAALTISVDPDVLSLDLAWRMESVREDALRVAGGRATHRAGPAACTAP